VFVATNLANGYGYGFILILSKRELM